jgi:phosphatidylserine decarboxylase
MIAPAAVLAALSACAWLVLRHRAPLWLAAAAAALTLFLLFFFRDPERAAAAPDSVVSPADGRVVALAEVDEPWFIRGRARQVSIFMSPLNVHVNRIPASGRVAYKKYYPGKFLPAYRDKASTDNEQMHLGIATGKGPVLVKQIAGLVARRIVCHPQVGEEVRAGQRMGLIKLGSRLDVLMPLEWKVTVSPGQAVRAGETAIAAK